MKYRIIQESSDIEIEQFYYATFNVVAFQSFSKDPVRPLIWLVIFLLVTHFVIVKGVKDGIESTRSGFHYRIGSITIHTVHIRNLIGLNQCMIETSVEICK